MSAAHFSPWAGLAADHVVAVGGEGQRTFANLRADVQRAAALLPEASTASATDAQRSEVLIACADRYNFAVALLASWARGHAAALPPSHRTTTLDELAADARIAATIHDGEASFGFDLRLALPGVVASATQPLAEIAADTHLVTLYTSGSTGAPRPSLKRADQLLGEVDVLVACFENEQRRFLCTVPPRHIYGLLFGLLLPLRASGTFVRETPLYPDTLLEMARRHAIDTLVGVPAHLQGLEGASREALGGLRRVFSSGAPLRDVTFNRLRHGLGLAVIEILGSTETGGIGYRTAPDDPFVAFEGVHVSATSDGNLLLRSPRLAREFTQPHACDDLIEVLETGVFRHLGRADDIVKVGGTRASLGAIEQRARSLPGIHDVALLAREIPGARGQEILLAAVGEGWDATRMRAALSTWLDPLALPRRYRFVAELPREPSGKLRRDALLALFDAPKFATDFEFGPVERDGEQVRVEVRAPAGLVYFSGHFDEWPVLPGVTQLGLLAVRQAQAAWPGLRALRRVRRLKFTRPIGPDQVLALQLTRIDPVRVDFSIQHQGQPCASGALFFGPSAESLRDEP